MKLRGALVASVIAMTLTATAATVHAGETPAPAADTTAAPVASAAPAAPPVAPAVAPSAAAAPAPSAATPLTLHSAAPAPKPLTLAPTNDGMGIGTKLLLVLGIGAGVAFYLKKKKAARPGAVVPAKIDILARTSIGVRSQLVVIEVEGTRLLVGMTQSAIQTLAVLDTPEGNGVPAEDHETAPAPSLLREVVGERPQNLGERFRSLIGGEEAVMPRISPIKPQNKPRAARPNAKTSQSRTKAESPSRERESREVAGQARGLLLSVEDEK